jgi:hypothetical protein
LISRCARLLAVEDHPRLRATRVPDRTDNPGT